MPAPVVTALYFLLAFCCCCKVQFNKNPCTLADSSTFLHIENTGKAAVLAATHGSLEREKQKS